MTLQIQSPYIHVSDSNGNPYVGATLAVYQPGTTTYADIYSDDGLSIALPNPLSGIYASNAAGNFPRVYIAAGTYKLRAETSAGVLIFEEDDVDTGLPAGTGALPISRGGTGATTAAAARAALDVPANSELTALSTQITTIQTALQGIVAAPQGRLTLTSATPILASDVTAATAVYYTPYVGALCPIYDGTQFNPVAFTELTMAMNSNHIANTIYDLYVINDAGTVRLVSGPAWNSSAAGAGALGSGAGTAERELLNGIWVNKNSITGRYGASTIAVDARKATVVGAMFVDGTNGQVSCHVTYGTARKWAISNMYNRVPVTLKGGDATASWSYGTNTWRQSDAAAANKLTPFSCVAEEDVSVDFRQNITSLTSVGGGARIGIGVNSTTSPSGFQGQADADASAQIGTITAFHDLVPFLGINDVNMLEIVPSANACTFAGTEAHMRMTTKWRA